MAVSFAIARCLPAATEEHMSKRDRAAIRDDLIADHIPYDIAMMRHTHEGLGGTARGTCRNAYIESFAIHARSLICFFNGKHGSDAADYTLGYMPFAHGPIRKRLVDKLNQQIA